MARTSPNDRLARLMQEAGFDSHKAFARAVLEESRRAGDPLRRCDHTYVARWLNGMVPKGSTAAYIAAALSRALRRPVTVADAGMPLAGIGPAIDVGLSYPDSPSAAAENVTVLWRGDLDELTAFQRGRVDPAAWNEASLRWLVDPGRREAEPASGACIGIADVERFKATAEVFVQLDNRFGGGNARQALIQHLSTDGQRLLRGRYSAEVGRVLFSAVAEATLLAAWMTYDSAPEAA